MGKLLIQVLMLHISESLYSSPDLFTYSTKLGSCLFFLCVVLVPGVVPFGPEITSERSQTPPGRIGTSTTKPLTSLEEEEGK